MKAASVIWTLVSVMGFALGCGRGETPPEHPPPLPRQPPTASTPAVSPAVAATQTTLPPTTAAPPVSGQLAAAHGGAGINAVPSVATAPKREPARTPDVIYVPTPQPVVDKMLEMVKPKKGELLYDLGCGDGRIVVTAAKKYGVKAVGYDIDPVRVEEALENVRKNGVEDLVTIEEKDIFTLDLAPANIVTMYLLPELNVKLVPQLEKMKAGSRVVTHDFEIEGVQPVSTFKFPPGTATSKEHDVYLFKLPFKKVRK